MGIQKLQITVLGPRGTGKTTLLTAMYEQFDKNVKDVDLELTPDEETSFKLQDRLDELKSAFELFETRGRAGLKGTKPEASPGASPSFQFGLGKKQEEPSLQLVFRDYPGQYHGANATKEEREFVTTVLSQSAAVLIPIDAPALMEEKGKYHDSLNRPQQIKDLFKRAYKNLDSPRLVILAPVKCEKYLKDEKAAKELARRVSEGYEGLLEYFKSEKLSHRIASVITPIQTVGGLVFSRIEIDEKGEPDFYFRKIRHDAKYAPKDSEQPLRYLLSFLLKLHLQQRNTGIFNFIRDWMGADTHLKKAVKDFSSSCKETGGFTILAGKKWLS
ncbi:MAG: hypothetical protein WA783_06515 [Phormidesmis sp.]